MDKGKFYFIKDEYFEKFKKEHLMNNKEKIVGTEHDRPCYYAFADVRNKNIFWMIPFSSKVKKYRVLAERKIEKYGKCNTIKFGNVLGYEKAFLIQNMCPITENYIKNEYKSKKDGSFVGIERKFSQELIRDAKSVLELYRQGNKNIIFPDIDTIYIMLVNELNENVKLLAATRDT